MVIQIQTIVIIDEKFNIINYYIKIIKKYF